MLSKVREGKGSVRLCLLPDNAELEGIRWVLQYSSAEWSAVLQCFKRRADVFARTAKLRAFGCCGIPDGY